VGVSSEGVGRGATFTVEFPVQPADVAEPAPPTPRQEATGALAGRDTLVADDDDVIEGVAR